jgi:hypothetical protein
VIFPVCLYFLYLSHSITISLPLSVSISLPLPPNAPILLLLISLPVPSTPPLPDLAFYVSLPFPCISIIPVSPSPPVPPLGALRDYSSLLALHPGTETLPHAHTHTVTNTWSSAVQCSALQSMTIKAAASGWLCSLSLLSVPHAFTVAAIAAGAEHFFPFAIKFSSIHVSISLSLASLLHSLPHVTPYTHCTPHHIAHTLTHSTRYPTPRTHPISDTFRTHTRTVLHSTDLDPIYPSLHVPPRRAH